MEIFTRNEHPTSNIEAYLACRLVPLDKSPGLRPIGIGEVLRRIVGKVFMSVVKDDFQEVAGPMQVCAGQPGGCEAAIHAMKDVFDDEETECILLMDAANAFNSINRSVMLENIRRLCPIAYIYVYNCYAVHARLFIVGGGEIYSQEGTTQGDPPAMTSYGIGTLPLLLDLKASVSQVSQAGFADDLQGGGKVQKTREWFDVLEEKGPKYGYNDEPSKSHLIVKPEILEEAQEIFKGTGVNVTAHGKKQLGAVIGSDAYRIEFVEEKIQEWTSQIEVLSEIANTDPHSAYIAYTSVLRHRYTFCMRTIPGIGHLFKPLESAIRTKLIPALTENRQVTEEERLLLSLPPRMGGMGIIDPSELADLEYKASRIATSKLTQAIRDQAEKLPEDFSAQAKADKQETKRLRSEYYSERLNNLKEIVSPELKISVEIAMEKGASSWLTTLPLTDMDFHLTKREFWDAVNIRYAWPLTGLPSRCACGDPFNLEHALKCKKGGFIIQRHNELRDLTADLLDEVCNDVAIEPPLETLTGETFKYKTANVADDARLDVSARGFWLRGQRAFFDVKVFNPNARRYLNQTPCQAYHANEQDKKRNYNERILEVENGSFTPLVFSAHGGMGWECRRFFKRLCGLIAEKRGENIASVTSVVRTRISFALLRSSLMCFRGTRHRYYKWKIQDADIECLREETKIRSM